MTRELKIQQAVKQYRGGCITCHCNRHKVDEVKFVKQLNQMRRERNKAKIRKHNPMVQR